MDEKKKILIVDDAVEIIKSFSFILEKQGYQINGITSSQEASIEVERNFYPVVLLDIIMPGISGIELLQIIRKKHPSAQVIMITGSSKIKLATQSLEEGAFAYLTKPVKMDELKTTVEKAFENYTLVISEKKPADELEGKKDIVYTLLIVDYQGVVKNINKSTEVFLGHEKGELIGQSLDVILSEGFGVSYLHELFKKGKLDNCRMKFLNKNKEEIKVSFSGSVLKDENKKIVGLVGMLRRETGRVGD